MDEATPKKDSASDDVARSPRKGFAHASSPSALPSFASGIPTDLLLALLLDKTLLSSSALLARHWLLTGHSESLHSPFNQGQENITSDDSISSIPPQDIPKGIASPWAIATILFLFAALAQTPWFRAWQWIPALRRSDPQMKVLPKKIALLGGIMFATVVVWLMALERLGATTVIIFSQFCEVWAGDLARSMKTKSHGSFIILSALLFSFLVHLIFPPSASILPGEASTGSVTHAYLDEDLNEIPPSLRHTRPLHLASPSALRAASLRAELDAKSYSPGGVLLGHACILAYGLLSLERDRATVSASFESGGRRRAQVLACVVTACASFAVGIMGWIVGLSTLPPLSSLSPSVYNSAPTYPASSESGHLPAYLLLAASLFILEPLVRSALEPHASTTARVTQGWPLAVGSAVIVGKVGFGLPWKWSDAIVGGVAGWGLRTILKTSPVYAHDDEDEDPSSIPATNGHASSRTHRRTISDGAAFAEVMSSLKGFVESSKSTVSVILAQPDSRKIFQFLCLNLAFMGVQLVWGVWTNSLGLISDAIHMFFDCAAIGMGLFAAVMASWKTDKNFTYGYGRVETLSGFANGVFLILISIFIVFEGVQRIIEPPEMHNTRELLIVSGMGLGVNLFGMWAMGGHHHHHGHSHGHGHEHDHGHGHGHSHNMMGVYLHVMADTMGSVGVILSTLLIEHFGWTGFDPIASLFIAFMIVASVVPLVVDAGRILCLDVGTEREIEVQEALMALDQVEGVQQWTEPRFWPKDAETLVGTIRVQVRTVKRRKGEQQNHHHDEQSSMVNGNSKDREEGASPKADNQEHLLFVPEEVAAAVDAILKSKISGLETLAIQLERGGPRGILEAKN